MEPFIESGAFYPGNLAFSVNFDGVQAFRTATTELWPVFACNLCLPPSSRNELRNMHLCALWPGPTKPTNFNIFSEPLIYEFLYLWQVFRRCTHHIAPISVTVFYYCTRYSQGCDITLPSGAVRKTRCWLHNVICDLDAKWRIMQMSNWRSYYGCNTCDMKGQFQRKTISGGGGVIAWGGPLGRLRTRESLHTRPVRSY